MAIYKCVVWWMQQQIIFCIAAAAAAAFAVVHLQRVRLLHVKHTFTSLVQCNFNSYCYCVIPIILFVICYLLFIAMHSHQRQWCASIVRYAYTPHSHSKIVAFYGRFYFVCALFFKYFGYFDQQATKISEKIKQKKNKNQSKHIKSNRWERNIHRKKLNEWSEKIKHNGKWDWNWFDQWIEMKWNEIGANKE